MKKKQFQYLFPMTRTYFSIFKKTSKKIKHQNLQGLRPRKELTGALSQHQIKINANQGILHFPLADVAV